MILIFNEILISGKIKNVYDGKMFVKVKEITTQLYVDVWYVQQGISFRKKPEKVAFEQNESACGFSSHVLHIGGLDEQVMFLALE